MKLSELDGAGAFVRADFFTETVEVPDKDGEMVSLEILVREVFSDEYEPLIPKLDAKGKPLDMAHVPMMQKLVGMAVMADEGDTPQPIGYAVAKKLRLPWLFAFFAAAAKHNGGSTAKKSKPPRKSGTS